MEMGTVVGAFQNIPSPLFMTLFAVLALNATKLEFPYTIPVTEFMVILGVVNTLHPEFPVELDHTLAGVPPVIITKLELTSW